MHPHPHALTPRTVQSALQLHHSMARLHWRCGRTLGVCPMCGGDAVRVSQPHRPAPTGLVLLPPARPSQVPQLKVGLLSTCSLWLQVTSAWAVTRVTMQSEQQIFWRASRSMLTNPDHTTRTEEERWTVQDTCVPESIVRVVQPLSVLGVKSQTHYKLKST